MKRTTISLPDELLTAITRDADRRRVSVSQVAREAFAAHLGLSDAGPRPLPLQRSGRAGITRPLVTSKTSLLRSGTLIAIVDSGPLYAVTDADDDDHEQSIRVLQRRDLQLVVPPSSLPKSPTSLAGD